MKKKYSYVSLLTNDSYTYGIVLLVESMKKVNTKYPLHVLVTDKVSTACLELLRQIGVTYEVVDTISVSEEIHNYNSQLNARLAVTWKDCWTKFRIFDQTQFDKIVFLDADIMVLKNLDHLFQKPHMTSCLDGEYFNIWPGRDHFNSGCIVIEPSHELFENIMAYANQLTVDQIIYQEPFADQELLNQYFSDWVEKKELHLNKYYDVFAPYVQTDQLDDLTKNCYFIHYVGRKPWTFWLKNPAETYAEFFYMQAKQMVQTRVQELDWEKIRSSLILTVYAICKNEIDNVENFINSFKEADYLCILDTGSTDGTWEYLQEKSKEVNNLIISQELVVPWRYDKARNLSMTLIPKETNIFFMADLDEVIKEQGWAQTVKNVWDPLFSRGMYDYHRDLDEQGNIIRTIKEYRIHSREWTHWINIVHEAICRDDGEKRFYMESCHQVPIAVWHYAKKDKKTNYMELCEQDLEEKPDDWIMRLQLAIEYEIRKDEEKAAQHYQYILSHRNNLQNFEVARCFNGLGRIAYKHKNYNVAEQYFREGRLACDFFLDNYIEAMEMYFNTQQYDKVIDLGKVAYKKCTEAQWCGNYDINNYYTPYIMGMTYWQLEEPLKAIGFLRLAYECNPSEDLEKQIATYSTTLKEKLAKKEKVKI